MDVVKRFLIPFTVKRWRQKGNKCLIVLRRAFLVREYCMPSYYQYDVFPSTKLSLNEISPFEIWGVIGEDNF